MKREYNDDESLAMALRLLLRFLLTVALVWSMNRYLPDYIAITGGARAYVVIAALVTLMNIFVTPVLSILAAPLKFFMTTAAVLLVNSIFLWLTVRIVGLMEPSIVTLKITGGFLGWFVVLIVFGLAKACMHALLRKNR